MITGNELVYEATQIYDINEDGSVKLFRHIVQ